MPEKDKDNDKRHSLIREGAQYLSIGTETFLPILLGALAGYYLLDKRLDTSPTWTVILTLAGFVIGMYSLFRTVLKVNKKK
ncbi:MAG: AtpZ/AtpI family protein [Candidatus Kapabacteria bacterium]|nr:AtpZ/AtpI family protein [Ignavibacteriota bacterium]MCW5886064.1 AtpZ/AtpI family protein [Candidatus Kapabacteria bacterium]